MESAPSNNLGRLDGVIEHAQRTAMQMPDSQLAVEAVNLLFRDAALMLLENRMPDPEEQKNLGWYAEKRVKEMMHRVGYVDKGKFIACEGTEYDDAFGRAARELLDFYSTPYFGHRSRENIRWCAANRILEVADDRFKLAQTVESAIRLKDTLAFTDDGEPIGPEEFNQALQNIVTYQ